MRPVLTLLPRAMRRAGAGAAGLILVAAGTAVVGPHASAAEGLAGGSRIVFASDRDGDYEIHSMAPDGSDVRQLTSNDDVDTAPAVSPDGHLIAFTRYVESTGVASIMLMTADGSDQHRLIDGGAPSFPRTAASSSSPGAVPRARTSSWWT